MIHAAHRGAVARLAAVPCGAIAALLFIAALAVSPAGAQDTRPLVSATVVDGVTARPVAAAAVSAGRAYTLTAADGSFSLAVPPGTRRVAVTRMGYAPVTLSVDSVPPVLRLEPAPYLLERIAVEARRGEALAAGTALAVSAVDRAGMDTSGGTSVAEALRGAEGVRDARVGSWGSRPVIRGLSGERVAVLVDGNRVNRACTFGMDQGLASVDPSLVERVEIVSGPGSALYGSGNVGGVINVVTRRPGAGSGTSGEVRLGASTAVPGGSLGATVRSGGDRWAWSGSVDAARYGDYRTPSGGVDGSSFRQLTGDAKLDVRPGDAHLVSLKGQLYAGRDIGWPMMKGAHIPEETRTSVSLDYGWQVARGALDGLSVRAFRQKLDHHMTVDAVMQSPMGTMTTRADATSFSTTTGARAQVRLVAGSRLQADLGAEVTRWFAEGTRWTESAMGSMPANTADFRTWPAVEITDAGAFAQAELRLGDRVTASAGARVDRVTRGAEDAAATREAVVTGNAGLRTELGAGFGARASVGLGYRNPDPMELYGLALKPDGFVYRGNPDLATERGLNAEASLTWGGTRAGWSLTGFRNRLEDMVSLALVPGEKVAGRPVREYVTLGSALFQGLSGSADADLGAGFGARASATHMWAEDEATGHPLVGVPPLSGDVALRRSFTGALRWVEVEAQGADGQDRVATAAGEKPTPGYVVLHARLSVDVAGARVTAGVENLLDRKYRDHLDPATLFRPGRNLFLRASRTF